MINEGLANAAGVSLIVSNRHAKIGRFSFIIWAKKETPFEDVWRLMELGETNKFYQFAIQDGYKPKRKFRTLFYSDRALGCYAHYISCGDARFMESSSNLVVIACEKNRLTLNNTPCSFGDLESKLRRARNAATDPLQIQILATGDCPYQYVIDVLSVCRSCDLGFKYLGLQPAEETPLTADCAK
jgi:hypothetical protein